MGIDAFQATGNVSKERNGPPKTVRTPENGERIRMSFQTGLSQVLVLQRLLQDPGRPTGQHPSEIDNSPVDMSEKGTQSFQNRLHQCIDNGGRHLRDIVFKTV
ncbi:hypothetical protein TNCV_1209081 [Trichonephila clavipes]|nr:hypothetical protein TNCV_1209081 [Trichonephila clavipes]